MEQAGSMLMIAAGLGTVLAVLHVLATSVRHATHLHDLRVHVVTKRNEYILDLYGDNDVIDPASAMKIEHAHRSAKKADAKLAEMSQAA